MNVKEYLQVVEGIKQQIVLAQQRAIAGINRELATLYWNVGKIVNERKTWGDGFRIFWQHRCTIYRGYVFYIGKKG